MSKTKDESFYKLCEQLEEKYLPYFLGNEDLEVQERATSFLQIIKIVKNDEINLEQLFYAYALNPVAAKAQKKVPIPVGLDLDEPFLIETETDSEEERLEDEAVFEKESDENSRTPSLSDENQKRIAYEARKLQQENNPNYLKSHKKKRREKVKKQEIEEAEEAIAENDKQILEKPNTAVIPGMISSENFLPKRTTKTKKGKKGRRRHDSENEEINIPQFTIKALEMPEGADLNDDLSNDDLDDDLSDPHRALAKVKLDDPVSFSDINIERKKDKSKEKDKSNLGELKEKKKKSKKKSDSTLKEKDDKKEKKEKREKREKKEKKEKKKKSKKTKVHDSENVLIETFDNVSAANDSKVQPPKSLDLDVETKKKTKKKNKNKSVISDQSDMQIRKRDDYEETLGIETPSEMPLETPQTPAQSIEEQSLLNSTSLI